MINLCHFFQPQSRLKTMPMILQNIDEICREVARDILFLRFYPEDRDAFYDYEYEKDPVRAVIIENLKRLEIPHKPCLDLYNPNNLIERYYGQLYLDVPYDLNLPMYQRLQEYLEFPDGTIPA